VEQASDPPSKRPAVLPGEAARKARAAAQKALNLTAAARAAGEDAPSLSPSPPKPSTEGAAAAKPAPTVAAAAATSTECPPGRRPYHVVMTAASGNYQEWQSRLAYWHYKKQKALHPCSDLGGFTRLFNTPGAKPDGLMDEMPTLLVQQLGHGRCKECDRGFIVMNRPWGVVQLVESEYWRSHITEEWIMVMETDHMIMRPPPNIATEEKPVGFGFYYMIGTDPKLKPVVKKFLNSDIDPATVDAVGPSPLLVHKPMLKKLARPWFDLSQTMQGDSDAQRIFGWVLEMWGYNIAARNMGIRHTVSKDLQVEPQGIGTDDMEEKQIYHYTFGLGVEGAGGYKWRLDKRQYYGGYPSDHLSMPPACSAKSGFIFAGLINEAAQNIPGWHNRAPNTAASSAGAGGGDSPLSSLLEHPAEASRRWRLPTHLCARPPR